MKHSYSTSWGEPEEVLAHASMPDGTDDQAGTSQHFVVLFEFALLLLNKGVHQMMWE